MTLENPYPVFVILSDNKRDNNNIQNHWLYAKDTTYPQGVASSQTDTQGRCAIELQEIADNSDIIQIYDDTFDYEFILDISTTTPRIFAYQNAKKFGDVSISNYYSGNNAHLMTDNYVKTDINLKTSDY